MEKDILGGFTNIQVKRVESEVVCDEVIPEGCKFTPNLVNGMKEGTMDVFTKEDILYAVLSYHNDKLDGLCEFFEEGLLKEKVTYQNGKPEGWGCEYQNSMESKWFFYRNGTKYSELVEKDHGYRVETEFQSGHILSICKYNCNHEREGKGFVYVNNRLSSEVLFDNNEIVATLKEFDGKMMTEYNEDGMKVYYGEYRDSMKKEYPREGKGKEYEEGSIVFDGHWKNNMKEGEGTSFRNHRALYVGQWNQNVPDGEGRLLDEEGKVLYKGAWKKGTFATKKGKVYYTSGGVKKRVTMDKEKIKKLKSKMNSKIGKRVTGLLLVLIIGLIGWGIIYGMHLWIITDVVRNKEDLMNLSQNVRRLKIPSGSCNEETMTEFHLSGYPLLQKVIVGSNACMHVKSVVIDNLDSLKTLEFGMNSFTQSKDSFKQDISRSFTLSNCNKLTSVEFSRFAFSDFNELNIESVWMVY